MALHSPDYLKILRNSYSNSSIARLARISACSTAWPVPNMTILVIEDSRLMRSTMERILVKAGHAVIAVGDGEEGLRRAQQMHPDMILLDMMLPTLEGTGVLRELKQNPLTKLIPVIVLSGLAQKNEKKLKMAGAAAYFEKSKLDVENDGPALVQVVENCRVDQTASAVVS